MDDLFELEDGNVAFLDYKSDWTETNFTKYDRYLMDVSIETDAAYLMGAPSGGMVGRRQEMYR